MLPYTKEDILELAGRQSYDRGVDYIESVTDLVATDTLVTATVTGREDYEVTLDLRDGLAGDCDCPWGEDGNFCKHCVAVALIHLFHCEHDNSDGTAEPAPALESYLASLDHAELLALLLEAADHDPSLRERLERRSITRSGSEVDPDRVIDEIDRLLTVDGFVEHRDAHAFADRIYAAIVMLDEVPDDGVVTLVQYALEKMGEAYHSVDDSGGAIGGAAADLAVLHLQVCAEVLPDPIALADWLAAFQTADHHAPDLSVESYADILGDDGLARYENQLRVHRQEADAADVLA